MRLRPGTTDVLSPDEMGALHKGALRILERVGLCVENDELLRHLQDHGATVDYASQRARFAPELVERFIATIPRPAGNDAPGGRRGTGSAGGLAGPRVTGSAGVYHGLYHDPHTRELVPWDEPRLARYFGLARRLPGLGTANMLGCRLPVPPRLEPLYERYYCWKYGARDSGTIHLDALCPYIEELCRLRADQAGLPLDEVFGGTVYLIPPLKLGRHEAHQVLYFWRRGLRVHIGDMYAMGATSPVTVAGSLALSLAEQFALGMLQRAFWGDTRFGLSGSISVFDMRTMIYPYGRPEMALTNMALAQMARHYGLPFRGHAGLTDAKLPSCEVGAQKALTAIPTLLAAGHVHIDAGLLSIDEVCSPLQMILDHEFIGALNQLGAEYGITDEDLALDLIEEVGPGGHFIATEHTARHFRQHWEPRIWSRHMLGAWRETGARLDVDHAAEMYNDLHLEMESFITPEEEAALLAIIRRAGQEPALHG